MQNTKNHEQSFMDYVGEAAPLITIVTLVVTFIASGYISFKHLAGNVMGNFGGEGVIIAGVFATVVQLMRIGFVALGQRDLAANKIGKAVFGFGFSLAVTIYTSIEADAAAAAFGNYMPMSFLFQGLIWFGLALELRLLIASRGHAPAATEKTYVPSPTSTAATQAATDRAILAMAAERDQLRQQIADLTNAANNANDELRRDFTRSVGFTLPQHVKPSTNGTTSPPPK